MTDNQELKAKAIRGSLWSSLETFSVMIVQFAVGVVLARLLEPKDFGLIALTGIFTSIAAAITDGGFEKTLIQKKELLPVQINTIFYINILLGVCMTSILIVLTPYIAIFFNAPDLTNILRVVSLNIVLTSLVQTQQTLLLKELQFKKLSYIRIVSSMIGSVIGLILAFLGYGVWSMVYAGIIPQFFSIALFWYHSSWYPRLIFSFKSIKELVRNGMNILASSILFFIVQQFNVFMVGRYYSKAELGLFNRGSRFPDLIVNLIQSVVLKMSMPLFSKLQDQPVQLVESVKKANKIIAFISFPLLILLFINAEDIIIFLFTDKWSGSIIYLQLFCIVRLLEPFISINRELILSLGLSKLFMKLFIILSLLEMSMLFASIRYGIIYLVAATLINRIVQYLTYSLIVSKRLTINWLKELKCYLPYVLITLFMGVIVFVSRYFTTQLNIPLLSKLIIQFSVGLITYGATVVAFRIDEVSLVRSAVSVVIQRIRG
jgi:teichuronic acid exporter